MSYADKSMNNNEGITMSLSVIQGLEDTFNQFESILAENVHTFHLSSNR